MSFAKNLYSFLLTFENKEESKKIRAYMRNQFGSFGMRAPQMSFAIKEFLKTHPIPLKTELFEVVKEMWEYEEREIQLLALFLIDKSISKFDASDILIIEFVIGNKSWWDTIDHIAKNQVGYMFNKFPELKNYFFEKWMLSENFWFRRITILFQLGYKEKTDFELLSKTILINKESKEFFIQKAIGWSLREYARYDSNVVLSFIEKNKLPKLSVREAKKHLK